RLHLLPPLPVLEQARRLHLVGNRALLRYRTGRRRRVAPPTPRPAAALPTARSGLPAVARVRVREPHRLLDWLDHELETVQRRAAGVRVLRGVLRVHPRPWCHAAAPAALRRLDGPLA